MVVVLLELGDFFLADWLQVVIEGVSPNDLDQILHRVQYFNVFALHAHPCHEWGGGEGLWLPRCECRVYSLAQGCGEACKASCRNTSYKVRPGRTKDKTTVLGHQCCVCVSHAPQECFRCIVSCMFGYSLCTCTDFGIVTFLELDMLPCRFRTRNKVRIRTIRVNWTLTRYATKLNWV